MTHPGAGTVHVVDDDNAVRESLLFLLGVEGLEAQGYSGVEAFLGAVRDRAVGCVISDMRMPGLDGEDLLRLLPCRHPGVPVIMITGHGDVDAAARAMAAGAFDFIEKPFEDAAILDAVRSALSAGRADVVRDRRAMATQARIADLSERDRRILDRFVRGDSNRTLATTLELAPADVDQARARIMQWLGARSAAELVRVVTQARRYAGTGAFTL